MFCIIGASADGIFYFPLHFAFPPFSQNNATVLFVVLAPYSNTHSPQNDLKMKQSTRNDKKPFQITLIW